MITFVLVHGTFVNRAEWPALISTLQHAAEESGETASFEEVQWSGKNSVSGRRSAADRIREKLLKVRDANPNGPVFVIAHSHGGNALAYFLSAKASQIALTGCAFLSTPFVAIRERPNPRAVMAGLMFVPALVITVILGAYLWSPEMTLLGQYFRSVLLSIPFFVGALLFMAVTGAEESLAEAVKNQTVHMPIGNYLFLRYPGDEAAAALSTLQFFSLVATKITNLIGRVYGTSNGILETAFQIVRVFVVTVIVSVSASITILRLDVGEPVFLISTVIFWISFALAFVALVVFFYQAFAAYWFGWTDLRAGFLVEMAIEPVPYGGQRLFVLDWTSSGDLRAMEETIRQRGWSLDLSRGGWVHPKVREKSGAMRPFYSVEQVYRSELDGNLLHSWTHIHPDAIDLIGRWITGCLKKAPAYSTVLPRTER